MSGRLVEIELLDSKACQRIRGKAKKETIEEYAEAMESGTEFPAVVAFQEDGKFYLGDGMHRVGAATLNGAKKIKVDVREEHGGETGARAAKLYACGANGEHGLRRTNKEKRRAVKLLLKDKVWGKESNREIAARAGVSELLVRTAKKETDAIKSQKQGKTEDSKGKEDPEEIVEKQKKEQAGAEARPRSGGAVFNRTNDNVEWALWTWNPVTGCKHDCPYCYARDIAVRYQDNGFPKAFEPDFREDRLSAPHNTPFPTEAAKQNIGEKNVFVCSMADLFGRWVPREWIEAVLTEVRTAPQWNFLFLTKFPLRYCEFEFPKNAWLGTTVDIQARVPNAEKAFERLKGPEIKWLSCEPLLEPLKFKKLDMFDWVVIGGASRSTQTPEFVPPVEWSAQLALDAKAAGCMVYYKTNMRVREYPRSGIKVITEAPKAFRVDKFTKKVDE